MKLMHKIILLGLVGAMAAPMVIKGPDGQPLMNISDWMPQNADAIIASVQSIGQSSSSDTAGAGAEIFYKWKDKNDVWQMTEYRPTGLSEDKIETLTIYANANIIQSLDSSTISSALGKGAAVVNQNKAKFTYNPKKSVDLVANDDDDNKGLSLTTVSMKKIPELMNQARNLDTNLQSRREAIDAQIRQSGH